MRHKNWSFFVSRIFLRWFGLYPDLKIKTLKIQKIIIFKNKIANPDFKSPKPEQIVFQPIPEELQIHKLSFSLPNYTHGFYQTQVGSVKPLFLKCVTRLNAINLSELKISGLYNNFYFEKTKARQLAFNFIPKNILVQKVLFQFSRLLSCANIFRTFCYPKPLSLTPCFMRLTVKRCGQEIFKGVKADILQDAPFFPRLYLKRILLKHKELEAKALPANFTAKEVKSLDLCLTPTEQESVLAEVHNQLLAKIKNGLRLIGEIDNGPHGFERLKQAISDRLHQSKMLAKGVDRLWSKYPGAAASFLVLSAIYEYRHGDYWDFTLDSINFPCNPSYQRRWGRPFLLFIHIVGLEPFTEAGYRYQGPILGHAMIPNDCLPGFFGQLIEPSINSLDWSGRSPAELIQKWQNRSESFPGVEKPVWQFLKHGGKLAESFVQETLSMAKQRFETGCIQPDSLFGLPERIVQQYIQWLEQQINFPKYGRPYLQLDPISGLQLVFPEQRLPSHKIDQVCFWEVSNNKQRLTGPNGYPFLRGEEAVFKASELLLPPSGPYDVQLFIGEKLVDNWSIAGISETRPWMFFSELNRRRLNIDKEIKDDFIWVLFPIEGKVLFLDGHGNEQNGFVQEHSYLKEEWIEYQALLLDLRSSSKIELSWKGYQESFTINLPESQIKVMGGYLLQSSENSPDQVPLYGDSLPNLIFDITDQDQESLLTDLRIQISGRGVGFKETYEADAQDLDSALEEIDGQISLNLNGLIKQELCPGYLTITIWHKNKRQLDFQLRWLPDLDWEWGQNGRILTMHLPNNAALSIKDNKASSQVDGNDYLLELPKDSNEIDVFVQWPEIAEELDFFIPLRLFAPRWTFLKKPSASPNWQLKPIEMRPEDLLNVDSPLLMLECRDSKWQDIGIQAKWICDDIDAPWLDLKVKRLSTRDRWQIQLAETADTIRKYQNVNSRIVVNAIKTKRAEDVAELCLLHLQAPLSFRWSLIMDQEAKPRWSDECLDVNIQGLLEASSPFLIFEILGGNLEINRITVFWQVIDQVNSNFEVQCKASTEKGKWYIDLKQVLEHMVAYPNNNSELKINLNDFQEEATLMRIYQHPFSLDSFNDYKKWAGKKKLHALALDLLCDLSPNFWDSQENLANDLNISSDLITKLYQILCIECPEFEILRQHNRFKLKKGIYRQIKNILEEWDNERRWKG